MFSITRKFRLDAAHKLQWHKGKCVNLHGHTYALEVEVQSLFISQVQGTSECGMVMDFGELDEIVKSRVLSVFDHKYLNEVIPSVVRGEMQPTAEVVAVEVWKILKNSLPNLVRVTVWETPGSAATYYGERGS